MNKKITISEPRKKLSSVDFRELWEFRELMFSLSFRNIKIKYKQTIIGAAWAILKPLTLRRVENICGMV